MRRALTVVATAAVAASGLAGPAAAAPLPLCSPDDGYVPGVTCQVAIAAAAECLGSTPVLDYTVPSAAVAGASTVDVRWTNLPGADVVLADQPLTVDDGAWPAGAGSSATVVLATTPVETPVVVAVSDACAASVVLAAGRSTTGTGGAAAAADRVRSQSGLRVLAETGAGSLPLALAGGALVLGGAALVMARRARQHSV